MLDTAWMLKQVKTSGDPEKTMHQRQVLYDFMCQVRYQHCKTCLTDCQSCQIHAAKAESMMCANHHEYHIDPFTRYKVRFTIHHISLITIARD